MSTTTSNDPKHAEIRLKQEYVKRVTCSCGCCYSMIPEGYYNSLDSVNKKRIDNLYKNHKNHQIVKTENVKQYICNCGFTVQNLETIKGHIQLQHKLENYKNGFFKQVIGHEIKCSLCDRHFYFSCEENILEKFKQRHQVCCNKGAKTKIIKMNCQMYQPIENKVDDVLKEEGCFHSEDLDNMISHLANRVASW